MTGNCSAEAEAEKKPLAAVLKIGCWIEVRNVYSQTREELVVELVPINYRDGQLRGYEFSNRLIKGITYDVEKVIVRLDELPIK